MFKWRDDISVLALYMILIFMPNKHFFIAIFLSHQSTHVHKMHLHTHIITNNIFILHQFLGNFPCQFTGQTRPSWFNYCYPSPDTGVHCRWGTLARNFFGDNFVRMTSPGVCITR